MKTLQEAREFLPPTTVDVLIYHGGCPDGFGAAFACWKSLGDAVKYIGAKHSAGLPVDTETGLPMQDWMNKNVVIADFSFDKQTMQQLQKLVGSGKLLILDHHKTALLEHGQETDYAYFDMKRSGATIAWDYFHPEKNVPQLLKYLQDRDIWTWKEPDARPFLEAFNLVQQDFQKWDEYVEREQELIPEAIQGGKSIANYTNNETDWLAKSVTSRSLFGYNVGVVNSHTLLSDLGNKIVLLEDPSFDCGLVWYYDAANRQIKGSLRSTDSKADVSLIAKSLGGGGHRNASGFVWKSSDIESLFDSLPRRIFYGVAKLMKR
jgi:oligoribonuclease NrnB/cAMP/cGMP phosphodiesterase (DHH superfamily)